MFILNGKPIGVDDPFTVGDVNYPPMWIRLSRPEDRAAVGITEVPDPVRPDDRFYEVSSTLNAQFQYDKTPRDLAGLKAAFIVQLKALARSILSETDWMVMREVEEPGTMPPDVKAARKEVRRVSSDVETKINACASVEALEALIAAGVAFPGQQRSL